MRHHQPVATTARVAAGGVSRLVGLADQGGSVAVRTDLEALDAREHRPAQVRPAHPVGIAAGVPPQRLRLELRHPGGSW
jgi:hypothetical protein